MDTLTTTLSQFHFIRPFWLLLLIPASITGYLLWRHQAGSDNWQKVIPAELLRHLIHRDTAATRRWPLIALLITWLIASVALAGPAWRQIATPVEKSLAPLVLVVDLSRSMLTSDITPDRLTRTRHKLLDILKQRHEGLTSLVVYAGEAYTVAPLTDDNATLANLVNALAPHIIPIPGSNPASGIRQAIELLKQGSGESGSLLLFTDGMEPADITAVSQALAGTNHSLNIIGVGTPEGAPVPDASGGFVRDNRGAIVMSSLDASTLQSLAWRHNGRYRTLSINDSDINALLPKSDIFSKTVTVDRQFDRWYDEGFWLVLLLLPAAALAFRRGWVLLVILLTTLTQPDTSYADIWTDLWHSADQRASALLQEGKADQATETFSNLQWKAQAQYQAKQYEAAAQGFSQWENADGYYNQGNALALAGKLQDSIAAYQKALELKPDMDDAKNNAEQVNKLLEQQQQQQQKQQPDQGDGQASSTQQAGGEQQGDQKQAGEKASDASQDESPDNNTDPSDKNSPPQSSDKQEDSNNDQPPNHEQADQRDSPPKQENTEEEPNNQFPSDSDETADQQPRQDVENWLRRIPDDPGGLLRRKFQQQQQQRKPISRGEQTW
ncbi:MAG: VWA domain-containing protein [Endozoicomonadaceae bacterium]|nr:VWA domain-containing protein [Endozoicomonadaceae bacterium]